ncbi:MAG: prepilin-type N-terminal cleavage/methylation domain-containing protein [Verrucomicrobiales bacterium]|jgi:prepilin-type N-terminal cleavage/methylation domain-containing protein|nr:prepilin-type N-terminal cleavage/methylation domain-containing protein [Verrucomicrobiales bacterium]
MSTTVLCTWPWHVKAFQYPLMPLTQRNPSNNRRGFTLIELLVVIAILGVLAALLLPVLGRAKAKARRVKCVSQLGQVATALIAFSNENGGRLPWQLTPLTQRDFFGPQSDDFTGHPAAIYSLPTLRTGLGSAEILWSPCDAEREAANEAARADWARYDPIEGRILPHKAISYVLIHGADIGRPTTVLGATRNLSTCDLGTARWSGADEKRVLPEAMSGLNKGQGQLMAADGSARQSDDADIGAAGKIVLAHRESAGGVTVGRAATGVLGCSATPQPVVGVKIPNLFPKIAENGKGTRYVFILDCSGSMRIDKRLQLAKHALYRTLEKLGPKKEFFIYFYHGASLPMDGEPLSATQDNIARIKPWVNAIPAAGGTDPRGALREAFGEKQPDTIWLMTDGIFKVGNDLPVRRLITDLNKDKKVRVNTVGFGRKLADMDKSLAPIASENDGSFEFINSNLDE